MELSFHGVSLCQHAGVSAALAEELPLAAVLAQERIAAEKWPPADRAFREALAADPTLQLTHMQRWCEAQDCLARRLDPLDDDPAAWSGLVAALAQAPDAKPVLARLGLGAGDLGRLGRAWRRKCARDPAVGKQLAELAGKAQPPASVRAEALVLRAFPWTPKGDGSAPAGAAPADATPEMRLAELVAGVPAIEVDVDLWAAVSAILELVPAEAASALRLCGVAADAVLGLSERWRERLRLDAKLRAEFVVRAADHKAALRRWLSAT